MPIWRRPRDGQFSAFGDSCISKMWDVHNAAPATWFQARWVAFCQRGPLHHVARFFRQKAANNMWKVAQIRVAQCSKAAASHSSSCPKCVPPYRRRNPFLGRQQLEKVAQLAIFRPIWQPCYCSRCAPSQPSQRRRCIRSAGRISRAWLQWLDHTRRFCGSTDLNWSEPQRWVLHHNVEIWSFISFGYLCLFC